MTRLIRRCAELTIVARFWGTHQSNELDVVGCADHHGVDARSVLGTVQGSSLRSVDQDNVADAIDRDHGRVECIELSRQ